MASIDHSILQQALSEPGQPVATQRGVARALQRRRSLFQFLGPASEQGPDLALTQPAAALLLCRDPSVSLGLHLAVEVLDLPPDALHTSEDLVDAVDQTPLQLWP